MPSKFYCYSFFDNARDDLEAAFFEFVGTTFFLLYAFGGAQAALSAKNTAPSNAESYVATDFSISASFGLSLLVVAWPFYRVTGGLFNPNVTTSLALAGVIKPFRWALYCAAQLIGGITAAAIISALTSGPLLVNTNLNSSINRTQGVFIEMFATAGLCLSVLMLAAEKQVVTPFAPVGIGLTLFVGQLWATFYTGCSMNTARSFGPAVVSSFPSYHWIYWLGPSLGSVLASVIYAAFKHSHYWTLTPHQASTNPKNSPENPVKSWIDSVKNAVSGNSANNSTRAVSPDTIIGSVAGEDATATRYPARHELQHSSEVIPQDAESASMGVLKHPSSDEMAGAV